MHALYKVAVLLILATTAGTADTLIQGVFSTDDQVELFQFTLNADGVFTVQSYGYAGGTVGSTTIDPGGFAPYVTIFTPSGPDYAATYFDNGGHCGITQIDTVTHVCEDPYITTALPAGTYYLGLSVWDNTPGTYLADGYNKTGNPGFTCAEVSLTGQFCDVGALYQTRTGDWALNFTGASSVLDVTVPEPSTLRLLLPAALFSALLRRRKSC